MPLCIRLFLLCSLYSACTAFYHDVRRDASVSVVTRRPTRMNDDGHGRLALERTTAPSSSVLLSIRGGGGDSVVLTKLQNVIRSLLALLERTLPILATLLKTFLGILERIFKVNLIPKKVKPKKKKKKKKRTARQVEEEEEEPLAESTTSKRTTVKKKSSSTSNKHLAQKLSNKSPNYRIQKELKEFLQHPPPNLKVKVGSNIRVWIVELTGAEGSIYEGDLYRLRISFPPTYPTVPPSVYFLPPTPQHEHVYTNGDICLSLLGKGWQPQMTAQSIAVSIQSILASASRKSIPMDNARHAQNKPGQYQKDWVYHDDNC